MMNIMGINGKNIREIIVYVFVGISNIIVNLGVYHLLVAMGIEYSVSNLFALAISKTYGYFSNKYWVFNSHCGTRVEGIKELVRYIGARGFSGIVDYFGLIVLVEIFGGDKIISKYIVSFAVIVINYILGKFIVFKKGKIE